MCISQRQNLTISLLEKNTKTAAVINMPKNNINRAPDSISDGGIYPVGGWHAIKILEGERSRYRVKRQYSKVRTPAEIIQKNNSQIVSVENIFRLLMLELFLG